MQIHNNTTLSMEEIVQLPLIGATVNKWRQRNITLLALPTNPDRLISVGVTFDGKTTIICEEPRCDWATALDYIAHGKVYVSE